MKIAQESQLRKLGVDNFKASYINAGGPGSGRHAGFGQVLSKHGMQKGYGVYTPGLKRQDNTAGMYIGKHPNGHVHTISVHPNGFWRHLTDRDAIKKTGTGAASLDAHLTSYLKGRKFE